MATWTNLKQGDKEGILLPDIDRMNFPHEPTAAYGSTTKKARDGSNLDTDVPEKRFVPYAEPDARIEAKAIYTVKAMSPDGVLVQLPLEDQINNNVASPETFVGVQAYVRKGFTLFFDTATGKGAFCPTWGCWAKWNADNRGFCTPRHAQITRPEASQNGFSMAATTSARWSGSA